MDYTISLYYVEGINDVDTPFFLSKAEQSEYFSKKLVKTLSTSYYPPYYRNTIKFDSDDLTLDTKVNYLSLDAENKKYYYFITSAMYISEGILELTIEMDVIQTYFKSIECNYGVIERKFINRFDADSNINRDYIRENVSVNTFSKIYEQTIYNKEKYEWVVIGKYSDYPLKSDTLDHYNQVYGEADNLQTIPECICYTPFYTGMYVDKSIGSADILARTDNAYCSDLYIIPFNCLVHYKITSTGTITDNSGTNVIDLSTVSSSHNYVLNNPTLLTKKISSVKYGRFRKNTSKTALFAYNYVPALLDENYISITFGDNEVTSEYPLHELKNDTIYLYYWADIGTGTRYYAIMGDTDVLEENKHLSIVSNSNVPSLTLRNDPWKQYIARNKYTYINAILNDTTSAISRATPYISQASSLDREIGKIVNNPNSYDKRYSDKMSVLKKKLGAKVDDLSYERSSLSLEAGTSLASSVSSTASYITNAANLKSSPCTISRIGSATVANLGNSMYISYRRYNCDDFENCAQYYHRNGYLVNEYVYDKDLYNYVNTRYYYNVLKMSSVDIHLTDCIENRELVEAIESRLMNGIRLWNVNNGNIGNYEYDNVEKDYITN